MDQKMTPSTEALNNLLKLVSNNVQSDHYATVIYKRLASNNLSEDQLVTALSATSSISSDYYQAEALKALQAR